jgi:hypothetical protein
VSLTLAVNHKELFCRSAYDKAAMVNRMILAPEPCRLGVPK